MFKIVFIKRDEFIIVSSMSIDLQAKLKKTPILGKNKTDAFINLK